MIYFYKIRVVFVKGKHEIIKDYNCDFLHLGELFYYLETKHKSNYKILYVKEDRWGRLYHGF